MGIKWDLKVWMKELKFHKDEGHNGQAPAEHLRSKHVQLGKGLQAKGLFEKASKKIPRLFTKADLSL